MDVWRVLAFLLVTASAVYAKTDATYPEIARELSSSRIVSGWEAEVGQLPFQLSMRMVTPDGGVGSCGGTILNEEWGLSAAHCTAGRVTLVLRAGTVNLTLPYSIFETTKYYNHPLWDESSPSVQPHDISILEFGRKLVFNDVVKPIRIQRSSTKDTNYDGVRLVASGWGRTWSDGPAPENLNWVYLIGDTNEYCHNYYPTIVVDSTICASAYNVSSQSVCSGDSGGPLTVIDDDGEITQVGVACFVSSTGCHTPYPAGFVRPGHYHDWLTEVTGVNFDWEYEDSSEKESSEEESPEKESSEEESPEKESSEEESPEKESSEEESPEKESSEEESPENESSEESPETESSEEESPEEESPEEESSEEESPEKSSSEEESPEIESSEETTSPEKESSETESPEIESSEETTSPEKESSETESPEIESSETEAPEKESSEETTSPEKESSETESPEKESSEETPPEKESSEEELPEKESSEEKISEEDARVVHFV